MKIEVKNISKRYGQVMALDDLSCTFEPGKIYGILGRNGAGKTTFLNILTNKIFPDEGEVLLGGLNIQKKQSSLNQVYYMTEQPLYPGNMRVKQLFHWTKQFYRGFSLDYANNLAKEFGLNLNKKVKELSTGYGTILKAILALASGAPFVFFDEPILGLDAYHRDLLYREIINNYAEEPRTILLSTHLIDEVAEIIEEVLIIKEGKLLLNQPVEDILAKSYMVSGLKDSVDKYIAGKEWIGEQIIKNFKSVILFDTKRDEELASSLGLEFAKPELQKIFIGLTGS